MSENQFEVAITTLTGKATTIKVTPTTTVLQLKEEYRNLEGMPAQQQRLLCNNRALEDERTLQDYEITNGTKIYVVVKVGQMYRQ
mmetsp:Transcript_16562/g.22990  ORF Transcript_16562/g.22990 Transcript_16562/m.22990 type:complete len:85 (-) Transcript_16562:310-564(-)|eukprot:CAMPEP_0168543104 /NCGR_PEP_ID=MMETSP0413-20121227/1709_1 /TAXON_ID=136452 /ORGANISM="Filamoeba nolandi, Strain NC-AS-23-1" /LENGTH=84 /DNA_ID=CAMNT_0008573037 /DNA_START=96 /DNA_END=350 /DNA_ORIENTATION=-